MRTNYSTDENDGNDTYIVSAHERPNNTERTPCIDLREIEVWIVCIK